MVKLLCGVLSRSWRRPKPSLVARRLWGFTHGFREKDVANNAHCCLYMLRTFCLSNMTYFAQSRHNLTWSQKWTTSYALWKIDNDTTADITDTDVASLFSSGLIEEETCPRGFICLFTVVEQQKERRRLICHTKCINDQVPVKHTHVPSIEERVDPHTFFEIGLSPSISGPIFSNFTWWRRSHCFVKEGKCYRFWADATGSSAFPHQFFWSEQVNATLSEAGTVSQLPTFCGIQYDLLQQRVR